MPYKHSYVYHGSSRKSDRAYPSRHRRVGERDGEDIIIFDDTSFHATPYRWIALVYTYTKKNTFRVDGLNVAYNVGVSLYEHKKTVGIYGTTSLEHSLKKLYGAGGYVHVFDGSDFFHTEGLGELEVITQEEVKPLSVEKIIDPVREMEKAGVEFEFVDLKEAKNIKYRNIISSPKNASK